jgi:hypothetical protein
MVLSFGLHPELEILRAGLAAEQLLCDERSEAAGRGHTRNGERCGRETCWAHRVILLEFVRLRLTARGAAACGARSGRPSLASS